MACLKHVTLKHENVNIWWKHSCNFSRAKSNELTEQQDMFYYSIKFSRQELSRILQLSLQLTGTPTGKVVISKTGISFQAISDLA